MGRFFDFISVGNIKVAAMTIVDLYGELSSSCTSEDEIYTTIYNTYALTLMKAAQNNSTAKTFELLQLLNSNHFKNFVDLAILDLNLRAAPARTPYSETHAEFCKKIAEYLSSKNIPRQYIFGDNTHLSK